MKIAIMTDLEGTAGVTSFHEETYPEGRHHVLARQLAMAEVNAAVDGFLEAGCDDVLIIDGHGPGGLWFEHMHPEARLLHGRPVAPRSVRNAGRAVCVGLALEAGGTLVIDRAATAAEADRLGLFVVGYGSGP